MTGEPITPPVQRSTTKRILLVDDDLTMRQLRQAILRRQGYEVTAVDDVDEARAGFKPGHYDLVVLDVKKAPEQELAFCAELKERFGEQSVVLLKGQIVPVPEDSCPDAIITKEDGPANFVMQVRELLEAPA